MRLQKTYSISVSEMASGIINGIQALRRLEIMDCYRIGRLLAEVDQAMAVDWFENVLGVGLKNDVIEKAMLNYLLDVYEKVSINVEH